MPSLTCGVDGCGEPAQYFPCDSVEQHPQPGDLCPKYNLASPKPLCEKHKRGPVVLHLDNTTEPIPCAQTKALP